MEIAFNAVAPFAFYLALGYLARTFKVTDGELLDRMNKVCFRMFFPFITFNSIYKIDIFTLADPVFILFLWGTLALTLVLSLALVPRFVTGRLKRGVYIQGIFRGNFVLFGIPLTAYVCGEEGVAYAAMAVALLVPIYNVLAVIILEHYGEKGSKSPRDMFMEVIKNPLVQGAILGLIFAAFKIPLPDALSIPVRAVSDMASPLAVFILGGNFYFGNLKKNVKYLLSYNFIRLLLLPGITIPLALFIGLRGPELFATLIAMGTPAATASFTMAKTMGGDGELAGQMVVTSTVLSVFTLFLWINIFLMVGV